MADWFSSKPDSQADDRPAHLDVPNETIVLIVDAEVSIANLRQDMIVELVAHPAVDLPGQVRCAAADIGVVLLCHKIDC